MFSLSARFAHGRAIMRLVPALVLGAFSIITALAFFRDEFLSPEQQAGLKMPHLLSYVQWYYWAILTLIIAIIVILEGSYRFHRDKVGNRFTIKPLASNIILQRSSGDIEPLRIIFWCAETTQKLTVVLEYSAFVNGNQWTKPRHIQIESLNDVIHGRRVDILLMYREPNMDVTSSLHWGPPLKPGEPIVDIVHGGIYKARVRFIGHKRKQHQNYYFLLTAFRTHESKINIEIIPDNDLSFVNEWELMKN